MKISKEIIFFIFGIILVLIVVFIAVFQFFSPVKNNPVSLQETTESITPIPTAKPQVFSGDKNEGEGSLLVDSGLEGVFVSIDPDKDAYKESPAQKISDKKPVPPQYTPFFIEKIPVGNHLLIAAKPGYIAREIRFSISKNETTKINIALDKAL